MTTSVLHRIPGPRLPGETRTMPDSAESETLPRPDSLNFIRIQGEDEADYKKELARQTALGIADALEESLQNSPDGKVSLALVGGRTTGAVLDSLDEILRGRHFDMSTIVAVDADERPVQDPAHRNWTDIAKKLEKMGVSPERQIFPKIEGLEAYTVDTLPDAARRFNEDLWARLPKDTEGRARNLDVLLVSSGEDGHIASIFPDDSVGALSGRPTRHVTDPKGWVTEVYDAPKKDSPENVDGLRLSLEPVVLKNAKHAFVVFSGNKDGNAEDRKAVAYERAMHEVSIMGKGGVVEHPLPVADLINYISWYGKVTVITDPAVRRPLGERLQEADIADLVVRSSLHDAAPAALSALVEEEQRLRVERESRLKSNMGASAKALVDSLSGLLSSDHGVAKDIDALMEMAKKLHGRYEALLNGEDPAIGVGRFSDAKREAREYVAGFRGLASTNADIDKALAELGEDGVARFFELQSKIEKMPDGMDYEEYARQAWQQWMGLKPEGEDFELFRERLIRGHHEIDMSKLLNMDAEVMAYLFETFGDDIKKVGVWSLGDARIDKSAEVEKGTGYQNAKIASALLDMTLARTSLEHYRRAGLSRREAGERMREFMEERTVNLISNDKMQALLEYVLDTLLTEGAPVDLTIPEDSYKNLDKVEKMLKPLIDAGLVSFVGIWYTGSREGQDQEAKLAALDAKARASGAPKDWEERNNFARELQQRKDKYHAIKAFSEIRDRAGEFDNPSKPLIRGRHFLPDFDGALGKNGRNFEYMRRQQAAVTYRSLMLGATKYFAEHPDELVRADGSVMEFTTENVQEYVHSRVIASR